MALHTRWPVASTARVECGVSSVRGPTDMFACAFARSLATRPRQPTVELLCRDTDSCTVFFVLRSVSVSALFNSASAHCLPLGGRSLSGPMSEPASRPARARHCDALHEHVQVFCHVSLSRLAGHVRAELGKRFHVAIGVAIVVGSGDEGLMEGG